MIIVEHLVVYYLPRLKHAGLWASKCNPKGKPYEDGN